MDDRDMHTGPHRGIQVCAQLCEGVGAGVGNISLQLCRGGGADTGSQV